MAATDAKAAALKQAVIELARAASIEINVADVTELDTSRSCLQPGTKMYVSHLPRQPWEATQSACRSVRAAGFDPVPHIPVRLIESPQQLDMLIARLIEEAGVRELLLIAGDYEQPRGPYASVTEVLRTGLLQKHGVQRISLAGHPEGHPKVPLDVIRHAERDKAAIAADIGIHATFLTQFFFEHQPFLDWAHDLRDHGVTAPLVGGLAGPASLATLFRYAMRCGVGHSIRALGARPGSMLKLIGDYGPENVLGGLAQARADGDHAFDGIHLFCFGGFLRTCNWLRSVMAGNFSRDRE